MLEYRTLLLDPPWNETGGGKIRRGADRHYPLIKKKDMLPTILKGINEKGRIADSAHCYLWVTNNFLKDGIDLLEGLGFRYITNIVWVKDRFGFAKRFLIVVALQSYKLREENTVKSLMNSISLLNL